MGFADVPGICSIGMSEFRPKYTYMGHRPWSEVPGAVLIKYMTTGIHIGQISSGIFISSIVTRRSRRISRFILLTSDLLEKWTQGMAKR